jgi:hypothetical protein
MIQGGWVCRACWKSNRPEDDRCYRCRTPREQQMAVAAGSLKESSAPGAKLRDRMDYDLALLAALVGWPMWLSGWLGIIGGVLALIGGLLSLVGGRAANAVASIVVAALLFAVGLLFIFVSRSVRRNARWAYGIAAVAYLLPSAPTLLGLVRVPREIAIPEWYLTIQTVLGIVYVLLGICAVFLLIASFIRREAGEAEAAPDAG